MEQGDERTPEEVCAVLVARASTRAELDAVDRYPVAWAYKGG